MLLQDKPGIVCVDGFMRFIDASNKLLEVNMKIIVDGLSLQFNDNVIGRIEVKPLTVDVQVFNNFEITEQEIGARLFLDNKDDGCMWIVFERPTVG
jgi:hypothetical protein